MRRVRVGWFLVVGLFSIAADWDESLNSSVRESNELYAREQFAAAQEKLEGALRQKSDSKLLHFNLGTVLFRLGDFDGALAQFQGALGDVDDRFASKVYYNIGSCQYRLERMRLAFDAFKKAATLDPDDRDARVNLELVAAALASSEVSQRAQNAFAEAQKLVGKRLYRQALDTLSPVLRDEPAAAKRYATFVRRLQQIVEIVPPPQETKI
jgi:tetratricopeptide (TPR) repeat protein